MKNSNYIDFKKQKKMANKSLRSPGTDNYERRDSPTLSPPPSAGVQAPHWSTPYPFLGTRSLIVADSRHLTSGGQ